MAPNEKKGDPKTPKTAEGKGDRKRLSYLKTRAKEMKAEMQAMKKESNALREKLGMGAKAGKGKKADDGDDE